MRGVSRQAQVRWEGHQEAGLPREGLRRHDDDDGEGQTATAAGTNEVVAFETEPRNIIVT